MRVKLVLFSSSDNYIYTYFVKDDYILPTSNTRRFSGKWFHCLPKKLSIYSRKTSLLAVQGTQMANWLHLTYDLAPQDKGALSRVYTNSSISKNRMQVRQNLYRGFYVF